MTEWAAKLSRRRRLSLVFWSLNGALALALLAYALR